VNKIKIFWWWILDNFVFPIIMGTTPKEDDKEGDQK
jgi:hypothetical protein